MKKQLLIRGIFTAILMVSSIVFSADVFAADISHTITIVNNSNVALKPTNNPHVAIYNNTTACTAAGGPAVCGQVNLAPNPPANIAANSRGTVTMTAPAGCNVSAWQTFWSPALSGKQGTIRCVKSPVNMCNGSAPNYTCTISQTTVNAIKGTNNTADADSVQ
ncbi:MAG: hypothetical protein HZB33_05160 [Nitrospirae bacterium]|nr:hypothetical protein [Nitrospirota bacterium]